MRKWQIVLTMVLVATFSVGVGCKKRATTKALQEAQQAVVQKDEKGEEKTVWPPLESGAQAQAENLLTKNYLIVLDHSGSMKDSACNDRKKDKIDVAKEAIEVFAKSVPADANLGLEWFGPPVVVMPIAANTSEHSQAFINMLRTVPTDSNTPIREALELAYRTLTEQAKKQLGYGEYTIVFVTDGEANTGDPSDWVDLIVGKTPITLYTIGFCIGNSHTMNRPGITTYREAGNTAELTSALKEALAESPNFTALTFGQ